MRNEHAEAKALADKVLTDRRFCGDEHHRALAEAVRDLVEENKRLRAVTVAVLTETREGAYIAPVNAPGHCHTIPGVWDRGNRGRAGKECGWCKAWNLAQALAKEEAGDAAN